MPDSYGPSLAPVGRFGPSIREAITDPPANSATRVSNSTMGRYCSTMCDVSHPVAGGQLAVRRGPGRWPPAVTTGHRSVHTSRSPAVSPRTGDAHRPKSARPRPHLALATSLTAKYGHLSAPSSLGRAGPVV